MNIILVTLLLLKCCEALPDDSRVDLQPFVFKLIPGIELKELVFPSHDTTLNRKGKQVISMPDETSNSGADNFVIGFSTSSPIETIVPSGLFDENCHIKDSTVYYNGVCSRLLSAYTCDPDNLEHWLVLNEAGIPNCVRKRCPQKEVWYNGQCVNIEEDSVCDEGEILYLEYTGVAQCDCEVNFVYDPRLRKCISLHRQGSCPRGKFLSIGRRQKITCRRNPCFSDDMVLNENNNRCYTKTFEGFCDVTKSLILMFNDDDQTASCNNGVATKNIFEVPALRSCPPGSRRGYLGTCERVLRFNSNPFSYRVPTIHKSRFSSCPVGHTRYPDGSCGKINSVLG